MPDVNQVYEYLQQLVDAGIMTQQQLDANMGILSANPGDAQYYNLGVGVPGNQNQYGQGGQSAPMAVAGPAGQQPPPGPGPTQTVAGTNATGFALNDQLPQQQFLRYLAGLEKESGGFTQPVRGTLEERGSYLSDLAPLFGYGINEDIGGKGEGFVPFYEHYGATDPRWSDIQEKLRSTEGSLTRIGNPAVPTTAYDEAIGGTYGDPDKQFAALESGLNMQVNPFFRGGLSRNLRRQFATQQVTDPNTQFLTYAKQRGWI